jgi:hypothetical protein
MLNLYTSVNVIHNCSFFSNLVHFFHCQQTWDVNACLSNPNLAMRQPVGQRAPELLLEEHLHVKKKATAVFFAKTERDLQRTDHVSQKGVAVR